MASTTKSDLETAPPAAAAPASKKCFGVDAVLRVVLFAATLTSVVVVVTSNQTELIPVPSTPFSVPLPAKFTHSPAFIYFVAALSVACIYSLITMLASIAAVFKPCSSSTKLLFHFALLDTVMLGLVASATGTAGGVAYVGLKGNTHVRWGKICNLYDKFCVHVGSSIAVSLFASVILVFLIILSICSLYKRARA